MTSWAISGRPMQRARRFNDLRGWIEPCLGVAAFVCLVWQAPNIARKFAEPNGWSASGLYSGIFSWASIQAGFLFAIYTFIVPKSEPFVKAIAATSHFRGFKRYMLRITYLTLAVAIVAFGLTVLNPKPLSTSYSVVGLSAWLSLSLFSFLGFLKVIRSFRKLDRDGTRTR